MLQFYWLNKYCTPYIRPILQYCKIIGTFVYLESREKSNEPIVETLAPLRENHSHLMGTLNAAI